MEFDSQGRLIVADRHNHRIQILTKQGEFVREYHQFGRTSGLAIDSDDVIYTADSESDEPRHPGWRRGIRIGSLTDGRVTMFVPPHMSNNPTVPWARASPSTLPATSTRRKPPERRDQVRQRVDRNWIKPGAHLC